MKRMLLLAYLGIGAVLTVALAGSVWMPTPELTRVKDVLEVLSFLVILLGVPLGLTEYGRAVRKEQIDREYGTYNALDEKYLEFQYLCFENPHLDIADEPDSAPLSLTPEQRKQELIAFTILFSIFERAFLMYSDQSTTIKQRQWVGWADYIESYSKRRNFRAAWRQTGQTFDTGFEQFMTGLLPSEKQGAASLAS